MKNIVCRPGDLAFGTHYTGATLQGIVALPLESDPDLVIAESLGPDGRPGLRDENDFLRMEPVRTSGELLWRVTLDTSKAGRRIATVCANGNPPHPLFQVSVTLIEGEPDFGDVIICSNPVCPDFDFGFVSSLFRVLSHVGARVHLTDSDGLDPNLISKSSVLLLQGSGLVDVVLGDSCQSSIVDVLSVPNLLVLACDMVCPTVVAANVLLASTPLEFCSQGVGVRDSESVVEVDRGVSDGLRASGIEVVRLHCPNEVQVAPHSPRSASVLLNSGSKNYMVAAQGDAGGMIVALGVSSIADLVGIGWPYDNEKMFALGLRGAWA